MANWQRPDLIRQLLPNVDSAEVERLRLVADEKLKIEKFQIMERAVSKLPLASDLTNPLTIDLSAAEITIGDADDLSQQQRDSLETTIDALSPWRKGPFNIFGRQIDAEWKSNLKWDRISEALGELRGRQILDLGCGNGYYMFRAAAHEPKLVLGLDPSIQFYYVFEMMQRFLQLPTLQYERLGLEHLYVFDQAFDIALCMGVLYHHRSPIEILRNLRQTIRVGGFAIIESQSIDGEGSMALFPEDRYAKARNVFFVPTKDCLVNWVKRSGFKNVEVISHTKVTPQEQRATQDMTWESLPDFLDPDDQNLTIEGYPGPFRTVVRAERKFL